MPTFTFHVKARVNFDALPLTDETLPEWHTLAESSMRHMNARVVHAWKDAVDPVVYSIMEVEAEEQSEAHMGLVDTLRSIPISDQVELVIEEARPVFPI